MKLYVLINDRLPLAEQGVQGGHCVAQWLLDHPGQTWNNQTLIYLSCSDLRRWLEKISRYELSVSIFTEPDLANELTAVAVESDGRPFRKLKLMGS